MAEAAYGSLPFAEQIAFFRRKLNQNTLRWTDVWQEAHDIAFMVAGANRDDLVAAFREAIDKVISQGMTLPEFRKDFDAIVEKFGWSYNGGRNWRSRVIYETNLRTSYAAGRFAQLQEEKKFAPYWQYVHSDAVVHPRPQHLAWNGMILDAEDPWWKTHYPPNGWGCQCTVRSRSKRELAKLRPDGKLDVAPPSDLQTVTIGQRSGDPQTIETPAGVDPGFGYAPGRRAFEQLVQRRLVATIPLPVREAAAVITDALQIPRAIEAIDAGYTAWLADLQAARGARNAAYIVGALEPEVVDALVALEIRPATAAIVIRDAEVAHILRQLKADLPIAMTLDELARLPAMLRNRQAVMIDLRNNRLLYVFPGEGARDARKIVVAVNYRIETQEGRQVANPVITGSAIDRVALEGMLKGGEAKLLAGSLK